MKIKLTSYSLILFLSLFGWAKNSLAATPTISGVAGIISAGQTLTISGANMIEENKTDWLTTFQTGTAYGFEGSSYTADGYEAAPDEMVHGTRGYDSNVKLSGNKSIYGNVTYAGKTGAGFDHAVPSGTDYFVRFYSRWHSAGSWKWPDNYIKMTMSGGTYSDQFYFQPTYTDGSSLPTKISMVYDSTDHQYDVPNFLIDNRWYCIEARYKTSAPTNFTTWIDNNQIASINNGAPGTIGNTNVIWFGMINMSAQGSDFDLTNWVDNYTVSTSRVGCSSVIEISNNSNYFTATKVYQEPLFLSDKTIQIKANLTDLGAGPYYLWITNNRQERSAVYNLSATNDITAPSVPSGLTIQ